MLKNLLLKSIFYLIFATVFIPSQGQSSFKYMVKLEEVSEPGFYQIVLSPALIARSQRELQDLRLLDANGKQIPYMLQSKGNEITQNTLIDLPIISKRIEADKQTHVVVENISGASINNLVLLVKNTDAARVITISGSDNLNEWYVIKENLLLNNLYADTTDVFAQELLFPNSRYKYFKIIIQGKEILPLNIIRVSRANYSSGSASSNYISIPSPAVFQKDSSDGFSYIRLHFNDFYWIDRLSLQVEGAKFFRRKLYISDNAKTGNGQAAYSLSSDKPMVYLVSHKTNHLLLKIQNDDNPPLKLTGVEAYQLQRSLITWLEKGSDYTLRFGDSLAQAPHYDLAFFKDSIRNEPVLLSYTQIEKNNIAVKKGFEEMGLHKAWIWVIIVAVLLILLFFTFRMTREINKNP